MAGEAVIMALFGGAFALDLLICIFLAEHFPALFMWLLINVAVASYFVAERCENRTENTGKS